MARRNVDPSEEHGTRVQGGNIGERITEAIERSGLSKSEVARRLGKGYRTIRAWEQGQDLQASNLRDLARVLGVTADELLGILDDQRPPFESWDRFLETPIGKALSPAGVRALAAFNWPNGEQPTVGAYTLLAQALGLTEPREG